MAQNANLFQHRLQTKLKKSYLAAQVISSISFMSLQYDMLKLMH